MVPLGKRERLYSSRSAVRSGITAERDEYVPLGKRDLLNRIRRFIALRVEPLVLERDAGSLPHRLCRGHR